MLVPVLPMTALPDGESALCRIGQNELLVANVEGRYYAVDARCTHAGQLFERSSLRGTSVVCPRHGGSFDITTGQCTGAPATEPLRTYLVLVENGKICVDVQA